MSPAEGIVFIILAFVVAGIIGGGLAYVILKPIVGWVMEPLEKKRITDI